MNNVKVWKVWKFESFENVNGCKCESLKYWVWKLSNRKVLKFGSLSSLEVQRLKVWKLEFGTCLKGTVARLTVWIVFKLWHVRQFEHFNNLKVWKFKTGVRTLSNMKVWKFEGLQSLKS